MACSLLFILQNLLLVLHGWTLFRRCQSVPRPLGHLYSGRLKETEGGIYYKKVLPTPVPSDLFPEAEAARARQAMETALAKYRQYYGPPVSLLLDEVEIAGEWAQAVPARLISTDEKAQMLNQAETFAGFCTDHDGNLIQIWISDWAPLWELDYILYVEKMIIDPPYTSDVTGLFF